MCMCADLNVYVCLCLSCVHRFWYIHRERQRKKKHRERERGNTDNNDWQFGTLPCLPPVCHQLQAVHFLVTSGVSPTKRVGKLDVWR